MKADTRQLLFVPRMIWFAFLGAQAMLTALAFSQAPFELQNLVAVATAHSTFVTLYSFAALNFIVAWMLPIAILKMEKRRRGKPENERSLVALCFVPYLIRLAAAEAVTLMGFVAVTQTGNSAVIIPFLLLSLMVFLLNFPSLQLFQHWNQK